MKDFTIDIDARNGDLARVAAALARHHVTLKAGAAVSTGPRFVARFVPSDFHAARLALEGAGIRFDENDVIPVSLAPRPGELAALIARLSSGGVGVRALYLTSGTGGRLELALAPSNLALASRVLRQHGG
ncbi:MAG: hypothetical protein AB7H96_07325 [Vicinamibacterales bacterium]